MNGLTVETYNSETNNQTHEEEVVYNPPPCDVNPYPRGTTKYYQTKIKLFQKQLIKAKLFIDNNIERLEKATEKNQIKEIDYIKTMDTMMLLKRIVIPQQEFSIKFLKIRNKKMKESEIRTLEHAQTMFNKLWMNIPSGRASDYDPEDDKNNHFNINNIASLWDYMEHIRKKDLKQKDAPMVMGFHHDEVKLYKECLGKWEREIVHPVKAILSRISN